MLNIIEELREKLNVFFTEHAGPLKADAKKQCDALIMATFAKCNLVTREEFDAQTAVLARTRAKLQALEKEVELLEKKSANI